MLTNRLGPCEVCASHDAKYTCPKCEVKTCSLKCVTIHKTELNCDGVRDRTKYIPIDKFTNLDLRSDITLLEDCYQNVQSGQRDKSKSYTNYNKILPYHLNCLKSAASSRKTKLHLLTQNFTRHNENTTYYNIKTQVIHWRIVWYFPNAENLKFVDERCNENLKLSKLLNKYLDPKAESFYKKNSLIYYQAAGINNLKILLKAERIKRCSNKYYELDAELTLRENLENKSIIEYPTILITFKNQADVYETADSDDEQMDVDEEQMKVDDENSTDNSKKRKSHDDMYLTENVAKKPKSLLFISEYSDGELETSDESEES